MHRPRPGAGRDETPGALSALVHQGRIRHVGASTFPSSEIVRARSSGPGGPRGGASGASLSSPRTRCSCAASSAGSRDTAGRAGERAGRHPLEPPLAGGRLSGRRRKGAPQPEPSRADQGARSCTGAAENAAGPEAADALARLAEETGLPLVRPPLAFVLEHPAVTSAIIGPRAMEQPGAQLGADRTRLSQDVLDRVDEIVTPGTNRAPRDSGCVPRALAGAALRHRAH
ncbi:hypothetical protein GCM10023082_53920 [Streptomyces tremellae]|uniref:NADP-dependent oxidoreductase domain-containing protein n=1 Tax=Streptomyces tremellae TaxID=1124239 RepID=A0ABP7FZJ2_9ACTN